MATDTETQTTTAEVDPLAGFAAAPEAIIPLNSRINDAKADLLYTLASSATGVTNNKVYPNVDDKDYKADRRDIVKHVSSRLADGFVAKVTDYRAEGGISFKVTIAPKSNRGRKPKAE